MTIRRRHSFTLMEVLVAAVLLVGMALALFAYSNTTTVSWGQLQVKRNQLDELLVVDRAVESIFPYVIPFDWPDPEVETITEIPFIVAQEHALRCAYLHRLNDLEEGALRFCEIFVEDEQLVVRYSDRPFINWNDAGDRVWTTVLAENVQAVDFNYADWDSDLASDNWEERLFWVGTWDNVDVERYDVPLAIKMTVTFNDGRVFSWLRRTMGNGYRERFGKWEAQDNED